MAYTLTYTLNSDGNSYTLSGYSGDKPTGELVIPDSYDSKPVTIIGEYAFSMCGDLTRITIPDSVTSIGLSAFQGCTGLMSIIISDSVRGIGNFAFNGCGSLTSITIPNGVTSIGYSAFLGCPRLTSVTIGNGVTSIASYAFSSCTGLTSIEVAIGNTKYHSSGNCLIKTETKTLISGCKTSIIPADGSVTSIGEAAFSGCSGLASITIPDSVMSIATCAFDKCTGLTSIIIPDSVKSLGSSAFSGCSSLTKINMLPTTPPTIQNNTLDATIQNIYVPSQSGESYKSATNWNTYADKITEFPILDLGSLLMYNNKVKAKIDADSNKNEDTYAKQNGSYSNLTAGKANIHTSTQLANNADLNTYYGESHWGRLYYATGNNSITNRPIESDNNGFSLEILRGGAGGTIQRCTIYAAGGSATQPVVFTRWHLGTAWKVWQETAEPDGTYPNMTVGKATNLTEPFVIGSDTNTAQTWVTKFATITLKAAWVSSATRFEIVDTNYTNNTTQPVGVEVSASPSTTALTVRAYALYGNPQILNNIYISHSALGTFPMTVDLYYSIENTAYTTIGIKPLWQAHRSTNSNVEFITTNTNVSALPADRTNIRLTELANYAVITRAGYDGAGNNIASTYAKKAEISNPNLIINPDFSINQRGQKSYTGKGYSVDRWQGYQLNEMVCTPRDGYGITLSAPTEITSTGAIYRQIFDASQLSKLAGRTVTVSFKVPANRGTSNIYVRTMANASSVGDTSVIGSGVSGVASKTLTLPSPLTSLEIVFRKGTGTLDVDIDWAKLEIGSMATEFIPPLIEEELLKCQALSTDPVQLLRSNSEVFTGLVVGQPIEKIVFNPNVSIEKMTDYLSGLTYDEAIKYDETAPEVQCVCKLVSIDWFDNSIAVYAINFNAFSSMMGTSGYAIGVIDTSVGGFVIKQTVFATEYSEANLQLVTAMADKNYTVQYTQAGWNDTKDYVLDTSTNHMIVGVYDNKVSAFIGRDSRFFDVIEMLDDSTTAETPDLSGLVSDVQANGVSVVSNRVANITKSSLGLGNVDNTADVNKVVHGATVLTNQDLNNYNTASLVGWYYAAGGNSVTNKPSGVAEFGLEVIRAANGVFVQRLIYGNKIYQRTYAVSSWNNWVEFANTDDIPTKVSQLTNDSNFATVSQVNAKYTKPSDGIPKSDLASSVQTSLGKADTAFQGSMELQGTTLYITLP